MLLAAAGMRVYISLYFFDGANRRSMEALNSSLELQGRMKHTSSYCVTKINIIVLYRLFMFVGGNTLICWGAD